MLRMSDAMGLRGERSPSIDVGDAVDLSCIVVARVP